MNFAAGGLADEEGEWEGSGRSSVEGSRSFWRNFWWREGLGAAGIGLLVWGESLGSFGGLGEAVRWERRERLEGEKATVAVILGGGVGGGGWAGFNGGGDDDDEEDEGFVVLGFGAKKREMTCCFCFPMVVAVVMGGAETADGGLGLRDFTNREGF